MRLSSLLLWIVLLSSSVNLSSAAAAQKTKRPAQGASTRKLTDVNVESASILGIQVGMSPRRVLLEVQRNQWTYCGTDKETIEDIIEHARFLAGVCFNVVDFDKTMPFNTNTLEIDFSGDVPALPLRVVRASHTYNIAATEYVAALARAKKHLESLGGFEEIITETKQFEDRLIYQKVDRSYIMYQFIRFQKDSSDFMVYYTICSY
jgi:hypothetical protein